MKENDQKFMRRAIELAEIGMNSNEGVPFGGRNIPFVRI